MSKIITRINKPSTIRQGETISTKRNYLKSPLPYAEHMVKWRICDGVATGWRTHPSLYRKKPIREVIPSRQRRKKVSQVLKKPQYCVDIRKDSRWNASEPSGPDWINVKPDPPNATVRDVEESAGNTVSADFDLKVRRWVEANCGQAPEAYGNIFNWARIRIFSEKHSSVWPPLKVSRTHIQFCRRMPDIITTITDDTLKNEDELDQFKELYAKAGWQHYWDPKRTIIAIPPLEIEGDQVAIYISEKPTIRFLVGFNVNLRTIAINRACEYYINRVLFKTEGGSLMKPLPGYRFTDTFVKLQAGYT